MDGDTRAMWDTEAAAYDLPADHGLHEPEVRRAWREMLVARLPDPPARVADLGCGTGTLSLLLAEAGHEVDGVDFSPRMLAAARAKSAARPGPRAPRFVEGDVSEPPLALGAYDVVLSRHVLWAMPDPAVALERWGGLLAPGGRLLLVEGRWWNGAGLAAEETLGLVEGAGWSAELTPLPEAAYWGQEIDDDRYVVVARGRG